MNWKACRKKQIVVAFREVFPDEGGVETLEGYKPVTSETHLIIRGVEGEEYPIRRDIFNKSYNVLDTEEMERFPIEIDNEECVTLIEEANAMQWEADHLWRRYRIKVGALFELLDETFDLDQKKYRYKIDQREGKHCIIYLGENIDENE